ncbi:MAG: hypothetical protein AB7F22_10295 [Reyranella sp.]|uniref:hypothetical protein n=1 Tax=Reyranella sp. TaxID=1929291 RepID=UPI003D142E1C
MTDLPGKHYGTLNVWRDPTTPDLWRYLPDAPTAQRAASGRAQVTVMDVGDMLMLTVGAALAPSEADLATAKAGIAADAGGKPADVDLRPADLSVRSASLLLTMQGAAPIELASARPSPLAPHSAAFSAMLQGDRARQAKSAMKSGKGRLSVRYDIDLPATRAATARLSGDPTGITDIEPAIESGQLTLSMQCDEGVSEALQAEAREGVSKEAAKLLSRFEIPSDARPDREANLEAEVTRTEAAPIALSLEADVTGWLK